MIPVRSRSDSSSDSDLPNKNGLYYTKWGLVVVFSYLLVGDFCLQFMEAVLPSVMPLQLDAAGASNTLKAVILGTTASFFNLILNPYISFKSDGMRTAWGRRRPILLFMTPFVCLALSLIAFAPEISKALQGFGLGKIFQGGLLPHEPSMAMLVLTLAVVVIVFQIFNTLMQPIFYYLFIDVVPDAYIGRFVACFRIVATAASYVFNMWIFPSAMTHTREIYLGAAVLYGGGFLFMTLMVKEGTYPPPVHANAITAWDKIRVYVKECYSHKHYLLFNARNAFLVLSFSSDMFIVFYLTKSLAIGLEDIGKVTANATLALLVLIYPFGILTDRFKPTRVSFAMMLIGLPMGLICFFFLTDRASYLVLGFAYLLVKSSIGSMDLPFYASIPPQERYGQFGSANQIVCSLFLIPGAVLTGIVMDAVTQDGAHPEMYRYIYLWGFLLSGISTFLMYLFYRSWRRYGGPGNYIPPAVG